MVNYFGLTMGAIRRKKNRRDWDMVPIDKIYRLTAFEKKSPQVVPKTEGEGEGGSGDWAHVPNTPIFFT